MAVSLLNSFTAASGNTNTLTVNFGLTASAGDLIVFGVGLRTAARTIDSGTSGYSNVGWGSADANGHGYIVDTDDVTTLRAFYKIAAGSETSVSLTFSSSNYSVLKVLRYSGVDTGSPLRTYAAQSQITSTPSSGTTAGSATAGDLAVGFITHLDGNVSVGSIFGASGNDRSLNYGAGGGLQGGCEDNLSASSGTGSAAFGESRTDACSTGVIVFAAAAAATSRPLGHGMPVALLIN